VVFSLYTPTQPLKAALPGWPLGSYIMTWQLDGGAPQQLTDATDEGEKVATAAVSDWTTGPHQITFTAADALGATIDTATTTVRVTPRDNPTNGGGTTTSPPVPMPTPTMGGDPTPTSSQTASTSPTSNPAPSDPTIASYEVVEDTPADGADLGGTVTFAGRLTAKHRDGSVTDVDPAGYWLYWEADTGPNINR